MTNPGPPDDDGAWAPRPPAPPSAPAAPVLLPGYRDAVIVARGGDSVVYRAHQESVDRDVAIKVVQLDDPESIARFRRELDITVRLGRQHPNIMTVLAVGTTTEKQPCLVMDFVELGSLHDRLGSRGPLPVNEVVAAGSVVADALAFAHAQGVLHRDVKPQNVLVLPTSYVLADFGLARAIDAGHSSSLERFSYRHASPQILDGEAPTVADDIYSLGSTLFTLLDGRPPFAADDPDEDSALSYLRRARTEDPRPLVRDDAAPELLAIVARCLAKRREDRFATAAELCDALNAVPTESRSWAPDSSTAPAAEPPVPPAPPPVVVVPGPSGGSSGGRHAAPPAEDQPHVDPAPEPAVAPEPVVTPEPEPPPPPPVRPDLTPPPVLREPEPVAVSALAHLGQPAPPRTDDEPTGRRPVEVAPPPEAPAPERTRWITIGVVTVVALVGGVAIGLIRSAGDDDKAGPSPSRSEQGQGPVVLPTLSAPPSGPSGSAVVDAKLAPTITSLTRTGDRVRLRWTDPTKGQAPFVIYRTDTSSIDGSVTVPAGKTSVTLDNFPSGRHCLRVESVTTDATGNVLRGPSKPRCVGG